MKNIHLDKSKENSRQTSATNLPELQHVGKEAAYLEDNRPRSVAQMKLKDVAVNGLGPDKRTGQLPPVQKKQNKTGLPDVLKSGIENLSGHAMDDVAVHYNSDKPKQLQAHAYAQGSQIHLAPGQEKHLPHEAWHIAQQKQGRVKPTMQMKGGVPVNDDAHLEHEADVMGRKALHTNGEDTLLSKVKANGPVQAVKFDRLTGFFSFLKSPNQDERAFLAKERDMEDLLGQMAGDQMYGTAVQLLKLRLDAIKHATFKEHEYENLKQRFASIIYEADNIASKITNRDYIIETLINDFNSKPGDAMPGEALIVAIFHFLNDPKVKNLGVMRNYMDMLTQFISDAAMKSKEDRHMEGVKAPALKASVAIQKAYLFATVQKDLAKAETFMILGVVVMKSINPLQLRYLADEGEHAGAKPKQREDGFRIDTGSMAVARAALAKGVSPDLVVGLPTGGAHAASRFAAAAGIISGNTPEMWLTRPRGVKEESKKFMEGSEGDVLKKAELKLLVKMLSPRWAKAKEAGKERLDVFVIDDGQMSGKTLQMTRLLYQEELTKAGIPVNVFTGIVLGAYRDEGETLEDEGKVTPNHADFVMNNTSDRAGARPELASNGEAAGLGTSKIYGGTDALEVQVTIILDGDAGHEKLEVKDLLTPLQVGRV